MLASTRSPGRSTAAVLTGIATRYGELLAGRDGNDRTAELTWSAKAYVWHVADNVRIWSERLAGLAIAGDAAVHPYDADLLAAARCYETLPLIGGLWSLER